MAKTISYLKVALSLIWLSLFAKGKVTLGHEAKDFDDTILYKIDFEIPDFDKNPDLKQHVRTFYTNEQEKYDCVLPNFQESRDNEKMDDPGVSPLEFLEGTFTHSCSYRIEAYWSYEICHGSHVRQYHEEREGKAIKFQEYYLGKWSPEKTEKLSGHWIKTGSKHGTTKIDNIKYPYFEMEFTDGTPCDIINAPRTTKVRYVCYRPGKNEIYSFKETSSCNYEAIILTSGLCYIPEFQPEGYKEVSIKCFNSHENTHKPLSMLRQELNDMQLSLEEFPVSKDAADAAVTLGQSVSADSRFAYLNRMGDDVDKLVISITKDGGLTAHPVLNSDETSTSKAPPTTPALQDITPFLEFVQGKKCLTGGTGWWKYEYCYGNFVRQFHKDKKSETELFLGHFNANSHRQWLQANPDKRPQSQSSNIWHHYEKGTRCDRTGLPREVDVKLTCSAGSSNSMYLLEPKTCQYILVFESSIVCALTGYTDEYGLIDEAKIVKLIQERGGESSTSSSISEPKSSKDADKSESAKQAASPVDFRL